MDIARKYKESPEVLHAIEAHHGDVEPHTVIACLVQAADAISASRPGARRENIENYVKRLEKLEEVSRSFPGIAGCYAIQAGREIRVMVKPEEVTEDQMVLLARDIAKKIEDELDLPRPDKGPRPARNESHRIREIKRGARRKARSFCASAACGKGMRQQAAPVPRGGRASGSSRTPTPTGFCVSHVSAEP